MTFSPVAGDNPFVPGSNFSSTLTIRDSVNASEVLGFAGKSFADSPVWPSGYNSIFGGTLFNYAANGDATPKSTGGGGSVRPISGLVYPRLV